MIIDSLRFEESVPRHEWPFYLPAVSSIVQNGLQFKRPITFIVGENGSGKSTIVEAIAEAYGLDVRGGHGGRKYSAATTSESPLGIYLKLELTRMGQRTKCKRTQGFFLRSETAKGVFEFMSDYEVPGYGEKHIAEVSHGEGYLQVILGRFKEQGLYLLDEPEAALSFNSSLVLMERLRTITKNGSQVICATHSPIITALPDADILELGDHGIRKKAWAELELIQHWRRYMASPSAYIDDLKD